MPKNILILKGSPRKNGNSSVLADQVTQGAQAQGPRWRVSGWLTCRSTPVMPAIPARKRMAYV